MSIELKNGNENLTVYELKAIFDNVYGECNFKHKIYNTLNYLEKYHKTKVESFAKYVCKAFKFEAKYGYDENYGEFWEELYDRKYLQGYIISIADKKSYKKIIEFCSQIEHYREYQRQKHNQKQSQKRQDFKNYVDAVIDIDSAKLKNVKNNDVIKNLQLIFNYFKSTKRNVKKAKLLNTLGEVINLYVKIETIEGKTKIQNNIPESLCFKINQLANIVKDKINNQKDLNDKKSKQIYDDLTDLIR